MTRSMSGFRKHSIMCALACSVVLAGMGCRSNRPSASSLESVVLHGTKPFVIYATISESPTLLLHLSCLDRALPASLETATTSELVQHCTGSRSVSFPLAEFEAAVNGKILGLHHQLFWENSISSFADIAKQTLEPELDRCRRSLDELERIHGGRIEGRTGLHLARHFENFIAKYEAAIADLRISDASAAFLEELAGFVAEEKLVADDILGTLRDILLLSDESVQVLHRDAEPLLYSILLDIADDRVPMLNISTLARDATNEILERYSGFEPAPLNRLYSHIHTDGKQFKLKIPNPPTLTTQIIYWGGWQFQGSSSEYAALKSLTEDSPGTLFVNHPEWPNLRVYPKGWKWTNKYHFVYEASEVVEFDKSRMVLALIEELRNTKSLSYIEYERNADVRSVQEAYERRATVAAGLAQINNLTSVNCFSDKSFLYIVGFDTGIGDHKVISVPLIESSRDAVTAFLKDRPPSSVFNMESGSNDFANIVRTRFASHNFVNADSAPYCYFAPAEEPGNRQLWFAVPKAGCKKLEI